MKKYLFFCLVFSFINMVAEDWPAWGKNNSRNMVSVEKGLPTKIGKKVEGSELEYELPGKMNVLWKAALGSQAYGNVTIAKGKVLVGTNNESPRDIRFKGDRANVYCLDEKTGDFIWQYIAPKLGSGKVGDWEFLGICSSPTIEDDKVYFVTNRCEAVCLDLNGQANGNQGVQDEGQYMAGAGAKPAEVTKSDADILWRFDFRKELGVFPHNITSSSVLIIGDQVFANTSNGVDWSHTNIPSPNAPIMVCLNKSTGKLMGEEASKISERILHGSWSSPAGAKFGDKYQIIFGGPDGICYGFDTEFSKDEEGFELFKEIWQIDCNPPEYRMKDGEKIKYVKPEGPSEIISTPVIFDNKVFITIGQDPEHGEGMGNLICIDPNGKKGKLGQDAVVWNYKGIKRSLSTPSVTDKYVAAADYSGNVHLLDVKTGKPYWVYQTGSHIWGSTLIADGKIFIGNEDGLLTVLELSEKLKVLSKIWFEGPIYSSPVAANGVLYIHTNEALFAFKEGIKE